MAASAYDFPAEGRPKIERKSVDRRSSNTRGTSRWQLGQARSRQSMPISSTAAPSGRNRVATNRRRSFESSSRGSPLRSPWLAMKREASGGKECQQFGQRTSGTRLIAVFSVAMPAIPDSLHNLVLRSVIPYSNRVGTGAAGPRRRPVDSSSFSMSRHSVPHALSAWAWGKTWS